MGVARVVPLLILLARLASTSEDNGLTNEGSTKSVQETQHSVRLPLREKFGLYYGQLKVGTPEQKFTVFFDTGSYATWLAGQDCHSCQDAAGERTLSVCGTTKSSTYQPITGAIKTRLQDGTSLDGKIAQDIVKVGVGATAVTLEEFVFAEIDSLAQEEGCANSILEEADGVVGLGLSPDKDFPGTTLFQAMVNITGMEPVFGIYLRGPNSGTGEDGHLVFGGDDEDLVDGDFTSHEVVKVNDKYERWQIQLDKISVKSVNGSTVSLVSKGAMAVPSPGSTFIHGPKEDFDNLNTIIHEHVGVKYNAEERYDCDQLYDPSLPDVTFTMGGHDLVLSYKDYIMGENDCRSVLLGVESLDDVILGSLFMEVYYTKFNVGENRVEFAKVKK